jgi:hypothetical protein
MLAHYKTLEPLIKSQSKCPLSCDQKYCNGNIFKPYNGTCLGDDHVECCRCGSAGLGMNECADGCHDSGGECVPNLSHGGVVPPCDNCGGQCNICKVKNPGKENPVCQEVTDLDLCEGEGEDKKCWFNYANDANDANALESQTSCNNYHQPQPHPTPLPGPVPKTWNSAGGKVIYNYIIKTLENVFKSYKAKQITCIVNNITSKYPPNVLVQLMKQLQDKNGTNQPSSSFKNQLLQYVDGCTGSKPKDPGPPWESSPPPPPPSPPSPGHHFWTSTWGIILIIMLSVLGLCLIATIIFEIVKKRKLR